jgi:ribonuclease P protein component
VRLRGRPERPLRLTMRRRATYHPPDVERAPPMLWVFGAFACLLGSMMDEPRGRMERIPRRHDEADLPAQKAPPRQGTRLPRPYEDDGRTPRPGRTPGTRSQAPVGLTAERGPRPRLEMLNRPQDFAALQEHGTIRSHPLLAARVLRTELGTTRFGLATGRALGSAVVRNRVRRRLREAIRSMHPSLRPGWDVLVIARPAIVGADPGAIGTALGRLLARGGVLGERGGEMDLGRG